MRKVLAFGTCGCAGLNDERAYLKPQLFANRRWICGITGGI